MADYKVPQAYRPDPGQLVMVPDQSTVAETKTGSRMVWVGVIIGGAFIAAACLWTVNALLERSVQAMVERNASLDDQVRLAQRQIAAFEQRKTFFASQSERLRSRNAVLEAAIRQPRPPRPSPDAPQRDIPPT